jgi:hypothetical protein
MSGLRRKPLPDELNAALRGHASVLPAATVSPAPATQEQRGRVGEGGRLRAPRTVQVNMAVTEELARIISKEAAKAGSTRRFIARLMRDAGYDVPEADLNPPDNRRRWVE